MRSQPHCFGLLFKEKVKSQILKKSLEYLLEKKSKGKEISYKKLEMAEYLQPINRKLNTEDKKKMFAVRNRMVNIKSKVLVIVSAKGTMANISPTIVRNGCAMHSYLL